MKVNRIENTATTAGGLDIDSSGNVGIGTSSPGALLHLSATSGNQEIRLSDTTNSAMGRFYEANGLTIISETAHPIIFQTNAAERARIDSSGRLLVGTSTSSANAIAVFEASSDSNTGAAIINLQRGQDHSSIGNGVVVGRIDFTDNSGNIFSRFEGAKDGTSGSGDYPGRLVFSTTADGASSPTERMRIRSDGTTLIGKTTGDDTVTGVRLGANAGDNGFTVGSSASWALMCNRQSNDGTLILFRQANTNEGSISVSGTTVSYNGAHLSRWSQLPSGAERTEILRGTVLSNIDEMCEWGEEDNEQLNRMKVSDVEGDKNVSGVFQCWDDDDDTYTNDFYCAMTGDFIIRIAEGVTVERGDLLMSAGDGTAKPQDDDIIRSKTVAKVTSVNVSCTYEDGSYCVPCVLMAC